MKYNNCFHSGKQTLKIFDGNDAVKRNQFRLISIPRIAKNEEVVVRYLVKVNIKIICPFMTLYIAIVKSLFLQM